VDLFSAPTGVVKKPRRLSHRPVAGGLDGVAVLSLEPCQLVVRLRDQPSELVERGSLVCCRRRARDALSGCVDLRVQPLLFLGTPAQKFLDAGPVGRRLAGVGFGHAHLTQDDSRRVARPKLARPHDHAQRG
jgi:hypothetical protein